MIMLIVINVSDNNNNVYKEYENLSLEEIIKKMSMNTYRY